MAEAKRYLTLEQFKAQSEPAHWERLFTKIEAGTFTACHTKVLRDHGIWIEELTPIFLKLDAIQAK